MAMHYVSDPMDRHNLCGQASPHATTDDMAVTCWGCRVILNQWEAEAEAEAAEEAAAEAEAKHMEVGFGMLRTWD